MATVAGARAPADEARFYFKISVAIALTVVAAFTSHFAFGRSSFAAPLVVHIHAVVFMGWVGIYVLQNWLVASGRVQLHRRVGWLAVGWTVLMLWFGVAVTIAVIQEATTPFFFRPQHFLIANPLTLLAFLGLLAAAVAMRRRTDWHRRLHLCAMAMILGPAFGRLMPSPFLIPYAFEITTLMGLIFPLVAVARDARHGRVHPAWYWGLPVLPALLGAALLIAPSPLGDALYRAVAAGTPGAAVAPLGYPPPPPAAARRYDRK